MPFLTAVGPDREAALSALRSCIEARQADGEFTSIEVPEPADANPWLQFVRVFADDETLEPMLADIYRARDADV